MQTATTSITCPECGTARDMSIRQARRQRNEGVPLACPICRTLPKAAEVTQLHRDYWTSRYDMGWIKEVAGMIWADNESD